MYAPWNLLQATSKTSQTPSMSSSLSQAALANVTSHAAQDSYAFSGDHYRVTVAAAALCTQYLAS